MPEREIREARDRQAGEIDPAARSVVLIGLMGAGKTCIGRRLASRLALPFVDADAEIEKAAGCTIEDIFESHGEAAFRDGERRVIARILDGKPVVLATGGGAYMNEETRAKIRGHGISVWLRAELDLLLKRTGRRNNRPLLKRGDRRQILETLMAERYPIYAEADIVVDSMDGPPDETVEAVLRALDGQCEDRPLRRAAER
ncbi:MAG: shikimate kinase [Rhodospirillaceae bacterium]|jgi:shikimate kinase|nr:shikimate kinase [Rhodospirillaceae bacterium]MBT6116778.1 shikimate kinase [Rhodospirillaceae bacterium]